MCVIYIQHGTIIYVLNFRHCYRRHKNVWLIHPISLAWHNSHINTCGRSKEDSSRFGAGNKQTEKSYMIPSGPTCKGTWSPFQNIQKWDGPLTKWIPRTSPTNVCKSDAAKRDSCHPLCAPPKDQKQHPQNYPLAGTHFLAHFQGWRSTSTFIGYIIAYFQGWSIPYWYSTPRENREKTRVKKNIGPPRRSSNRYGKIQEIEYINMQVDDPEQVVFEETPSGKNTPLPPPPTKYNPRPSFRPQ